MKIKTALIFTAPFAALSSFAMAGGLSDGIVEPPVEVVEIEEPSGSSVNPTFVILGVLAALLVAAAVAEDD